MPTTRNRWQADLQLANTRETQSKVNNHENDKDQTVAREAKGFNQSDDESRSPIEYVETADNDHHPDDHAGRNRKRRRLLSPKVSSGALASSPQDSTFTKDTSDEDTDEDTLDQTIAASQQDHKTTKAVNGVSSTEDIHLSSRKARIDNLSMLNNLASQLLSALAKLTASEALQLARNPVSNAAREYGAVRSIFEPVRKIYGTGSAFLSATKLEIDDPRQIDILRKANQAIYMSSIFTGEIGLRDMDQNFLDIFVPENGRLLKPQGSIFLELKTQAFITARRTGAAELQVVMDDLFPLDMEVRLLEKRPGAKTIAPSEQDFLKRLASRREILLTDLKNGTLDKVPIRYRWEDFSREVSAYLAKNFDGYSQTARVASPGTVATNGNNTVVPPPPLPQVKLEGQFSIYTSTKSHAQSESQAPISVSPAVNAVSLTSLNDFVAQAARAAEIAMQGPSDLPPPSNHVAPTSRASDQVAQVQTNFQHYNPDHSGSMGFRLSPSPSSRTDVPHRSQTAPTQVLYERARLVATAKASQGMRKPSTPNQRRPWGPEEENALMTGLDQVKGPHWSQILAMYGPGGTINESLKDRNQVQLKDKARNLKLFFLKSGIEVPYYLQYVTGDLKSRAPTQASKQEAREREKLELGEVKAHFQGLHGVTALAARDREESCTITSPLASLSPEGNKHDLDLAFQSSQVDLDTGFGTEMIDVETMIARAAAEASQSLNTPGWNR